MAAGDHFPKFTSGNRAFVDALNDISKQLRRQSFRFLPAGWSQGPNGIEPSESGSSESSNWPFEPYFDDSGNAYIRPGRVFPGSGGSGIMPTMGGTALDNSTPPSISGKDSGTHVPWLKITHVPASESFTDPFAGGTKYRLAGGGTVSTVTIEWTTSVTSAPSGSTAPAVNVSTGAVTTNGVYMVPIAEIVDGVVPAKPDVFINTHIQAHACPPNSIVVTRRNDT